jgi:hypothetical protein
LKTTYFNKALKHYILFEIIAMGWYCVVFDDTIAIFNELDYYMCTAKLFVTHVIYKMRLQRALSSCMPKGPWNRRAEPVPKV